MTSMTSIDSYQRIETLPITNSPSAATINKNKAFLIEGESLGESMHFPELSLAKKLATENGIEAFDCIQSFDTFHVTSFFESQSVRDHKKIAIFIIKLFSGESSISTIVEEVIEPALHELVSKGVYREMPEWVTTLKNDFAQSVQELRDCYLSEQEWEKDFDSLHSSMLDLSNQISAKSFFSYLQDHPEIEEVYGILGLNHIDFLDKHAKQVDRTPKENHLEIVFLNRIIIVHLFGGTHSDVSHFDAMASFASQQGLIVPERESNKKELLKLLISPSYLREKSRMLEDSLEIPTLKSTEERLQKAEQKFDYWMKVYNHSENMTHAEKLLQWLDYDEGGKLVANYDEFTELAKRLNQIGYEIEEMPSLEQFDEVMKNYGVNQEHQQRIFEGLFGKLNAPVSSTEITTPKSLSDNKLEVTAQVFDSWMKRDSHTKADGEELLFWLYNDCGGDLVENYEEFTELAKRLNQMGYKIDEVPSQEHFDAAKRGESLPTIQKTPKLSAEERLQRAEQKFDYWMKKYKHTESNEEELLQWLYYDSGRKLVENYDEFTELAKRLKQMGYEIEEVPSQGRFDVAKKKFLEEMI
ncbi:MAG: hypothetical protein PVI40_04970 [Chlamydiota bacterium]|jgi:trans-aconitate methyltransferase